ncbi:MAG: 3-deoxy-manno-octulosonate cytidylyltransferase [Pseudomonadota bacterium]
MTVHVVIPARLASTRLPDKPLADLAGMPMVVRVAQQVARSDVESIHVAVDDERVLRTVLDAGVPALMTRQDHPAGSDRVMEVAERHQWPDEDVVINVQGDEPLMPPTVVNFLAGVMADNPALQLATLAESIEHETDFHDPNVVKVVCDRHGDALYFSRAPIPYPREPATELPGVLRHVGVYAFRVGALRDFVSMQGSRLESIEKLEQLRWLEAGHKIRVLLSPAPVPGGVDTAEDLARIRKLLAEQV